MPSTPKRESSEAMSEADLHGHEWFEFENTEFKRRFALQKGKKIQKPCVLDWSYLRKYRIGAEFERYLTPPWRKLFTLEPPYYPELALEFVSSFVLTRADILYDPINDGVVRFRLRGRTHRMSLRQFAVSTGLYEEEDVRTDGFLNAFTFERPDQDYSKKKIQLWKRICRPGYQAYKASCMITSNIVNPAYRLLHKCICKTLTPRDKSETLCTKEDMFYLHCLIDHVPCNLALSLAYLFHSYEHSRPSVVGAAIVTNIAKALHVSLDGLTEMRDFEKWGKTWLISNGVIEVSGATCVPKGGDPKGKLGKVRDETTAAACSSGGLSNHQLHCRIEQAVFRNEQNLMRHEQILYWHDQNLMFLARHHGIPIPNAAAQLQTDTVVESVVAKSSKTTGVHAVEAAVKDLEENVPKNSHYLENSQDYRNPENCQDPQVFSNLNHVPLTKDLQMPQNTKKDAPGEVGLQINCDTIRSREYEVGNEENGGNIKRSRTSEEGDYSVHSDPETPNSGGSAIHLAVGKDASGNIGKGNVSQSSWSLNEIGADLRAMKVTRDHELEVMKQRVELMKKRLELEQIRELKKEERNTKKAYYMHLNTLFAKEHLSPEDEDIKRRLVEMLYGK